MDTLRVLTPADLDTLVALSGGAGWNQTRADWARLLEMEPEGCFGVLVDDRLVATATLVCYGQAMAWLGMVLTHPDYRGRGHGGRVTSRAMTCAWERGVRVLKLDATDMGHPVYRKLGFRDEVPVERWAAPPETTVKPNPAGCVESGAPDIELDRTAFGADRTRLLRHLAPHGATTIPGRGYVLTRPGVHAAHLGPCVARDGEAARLLMTAAVTAHPGSTRYWDLLPGNRPAAELATELGFRPTRRLTRMSVTRAGGDVAHDDGLVWAAAGFEYG